MGDAKGLDLRIHDARPYVIYGHQRIHFTRYTRRIEKTSVMIKVQPDGLVEAHAPESASDKEVREAIKARASWIARQLRQFESSRGTTPGHSFSSGESHYYLGKQYLLKVYPAGREAETVKLVQGRFEVIAKGKRPERTRALLDEWYAEHARDYFRKRVTALSDSLPWVKMAPPMTIKPMSRRWGSCSPSGRLTLNLHLIRAPRICIDYVILHELCHLKERSHGKRFLELMNSVMPGWEEPKRILDNKAAYWLNGN